MVREISTPGLIEKNRTETASAFLVLWEVQVGDVERLFLVNNEEDVVFDGQTYRKFPIAFSEMEENLRGDLPVLDVAVSNATLEVQAFLERRNGLLDREVRITFVSEALLDDPAAAVSQVFTITSSTADADQVSFRLSQLPLLEINLPHQHYSRTRCRFGFKSPECGFTLDSSTTCSKLQFGENGCSAHGALELAAGQPVTHPDRWGAFASIPRRRV